MDIDELMCQNCGKMSDENNCDASKMTSPTAIDFSLVRKPNRVETCVFGFRAHRRSRSVLEPPFSGPALRASRDVPGLACPPSRPAPPPRSRRPSPASGSGPTTRAWPSVCCSTSRPGGWRAAPRRGPRAAPGSPASAPPPRRRPRRCRPCPRPPLPPAQRRGRCRIPMRAPSRG